MEFACAKNGCDHSVADKDLQHRNEASSAGYCADISPNSTSHEYMNIQCGTLFYFPKFFIAVYPKAPTGSTNWSKARNLTCVNGKFQHNALEKWTNSNCDSGSSWWCRTAFRRSRKAVNCAFLEMKYLYDDDDDATRRPTSYT